MNVYRGELNRMTTKGFIEVRIMLRVKPRECGNAITSRSCKIASCKVSIKQKKDVILVAEDRVYTVEIKNYCVFHTGVPM